MRVGDSSSISHILITPSFEPDTNKPRHDVLRERPGEKIKTKIYEITVI